ncbi:DNA repair protein RecN [Terrarubrum flagellatum]|uniref:DNA repair protein RecN n=1 Tax=Terrirubrum flagellatum TaxID=2895980 RepID=UPI003144EBD1
MLVQLAIRDIVLIEKLDLAFGDGLSVLTGETGAGKSILLDSLSLALGARGDGGLVRQGQSQGQVTAVFDLGEKHPVRAAASAYDVVIDGDLILKRVQFADGRTRASVNDQPVSAQALRAISAGLVELHGQHDDRALVDPSSHRLLLDQFGGHLALRDKVREAHKNFADAREALELQRASVEVARREAEFLRHAVQELDKLAPIHGEEALLAARRQTMMQAEKVRQEIAEAVDSVGGQGSPIPNLSASMRRLERRATQAPELITPSVKALDAALQALEEARDTLERALRDCDFDPRELELSEERLFELRAAARKYQCAPDELAARAEKFRGDVELIDSGERALVAQERSMAEAEAAYLNAADALSEARKKAAAKLDKAVRAELPPLKLERASFTTNVAVDKTQRGPDGYERIEFWVQTNPGSRPGPMVKVASGGELARFLLALKVVIADRGSAPTLVFDEIDTGVGGAVADAIGKRLKRLASSVQVLCVTHAPQVAALASRHFLIAKEGAAKGQRVATRVSALDETMRREEIARMLAGATITEEARAAAGRLLRAPSA